MARHTNSDFHQFQSELNLVLDDPQDGWVVSLEIPDWQLNDVSGSGIEDIRGIRVNHSDVENLMEYTRK